MPAMYIQIWLPGFGITDSTVSISTCMLVYFYATMFPETTVQAELYGDGDTDTTVNTLEAPVLHGDFLDTLLEISVDCWLL